MDYLYLHGFASGPQSTKAQFLKQQFAAIAQPLHIPDLNQNDFAHLTLSRQIQHCLDWLAERDHVTIIGSSFGGLTAVWMAQQPTARPKLDRLILLAPAFQFLDQWLPRLGPATVAQWRTTGWLSVYHYAHAEMLPLSYDFVTDAERYCDRLLDTPLPTLILHGKRDDVIPIQASRNYAATRSWVQLTELDSDHALGDVQPEIWEHVRRFLNI